MPKKWLRLCHLQNIFIQFWPQQIDTVYTQEHDNTSVVAGIRDPQQNTTMTINEYVSVISVCFVLQCGDCACELNGDLDSELE